MELSTKMEAVALIITITLILFHFDPQNQTNRKYLLFNGCLFSSAITIGLDLFTSWLINAQPTIPLWLNMHLNTLYFLAQHLTFSLMAGYCFYLLFEHSSDWKCLYIATTVIGIFFTLLEIGVLCNYKTRWFFYFEDGVYMRGPFNKVGYAAVAIELTMLVICYLRHRAIASRSLRKLMHIMPPLILFLGIMQQIFPNILMNGTISSLANLILFICFQSSRIGQDALTGLPNRHTFFQEMEARRRKPQYFHLILFYLEDMEMINRKFGIKEGDALLYMVGRYLEEYAPHYRAFRFSSTSFLLYGSFPDYPEHTKQVAQALRNRFEKPWEAAGITSRINVSVAHMICNSSESDDSYLISQLEYALARAREAGGGSVVFFDSRLKEQFERSQYVLTQVRQALEEESFQIFLQPIYSLKEKIFTSGEVLLRLNDKAGHAISPGEFIPLAEKTGLIDEISWLVLKKACHFLAGDPELPLQTISVNMTAQQLNDPAFSRKIHSCLNQYGISPERLRIEITERTITENPPLVRSVMTQMTEEGLQFYLDDFGIGYSNLAGMMALPFETVKLDSSLLQNIAQNEKAFQVVKLLVDLLHHAGFIVVAEGLETKEQVEKAEEIGFDRIQGFYFAQPMPVEELESFLAL